MSDLGRVRSLDRVITRSNGWKQTWRGQQISPAKKSTGYLHVTLNRCGESTTMLVHRLVLLAFVGPAPEGAQGCHGNGQPCDNRLANLRWDSRAGNMADQVRHGTRNSGERNGKAKLTEAQVLAIRAQPGKSHTALANQYGVSPGAISLIRSRKTWGHLPEVQTPAS